MIKHWPKASQRGKGLFHLRLPGHSSSVKEVQELKNLKAEVKQKPWRSVAYWLVPRGLLDLLLPYTTQNKR